MAPITKADIIQAFTNRKKGKLNLLYLYYKEQYFHQKLSAELIAQKLSAELDLLITPTHIYDIHRRYCQTSETDSIQHQLDQLKDQIKMLEQAKLEQGNQQLMHPTATESLPESSPMLSSLTDSTIRVNSTIQNQNSVPEPNEPGIQKPSLTYVNQEDEPHKNPYIDLMKGL